MTWTKLDDGVFDHPKMVRAGEDAANLYVRGLVYCNRYLTDGRLDPEVLSVLTRKRDALKLADALVRVGAWEPREGGGWLVHNFHEHNPTAEEVEARRAEISRKRSEAGKRGGLRSGEARSNEAKPKQPALCATKQNGSPDPSRPGLGSDDDDDKAAGRPLLLRSQTEHRTRAVSAMRSRCSRRRAAAWCRCSLARPTWWRSTTS